MNAVDVVASAPFCNPIYFEKRCNLLREKKRRKTNNKKKHIYEITDTLGVEREDKKERRR